MLISLLAAWWVTRTREVGSAQNSPWGNVEPSYGVHHGLTKDARQRLRIVLFTAGIVAWSCLGVAGFFWLVFDIGVLPLQ